MKIFYTLCLLFISFTVAGCGTESKQTPADSNTLDPTYEETGVSQAQELQKIAELRGAFMDASALCQIDPKTDDLSESPSCPANIVQGINKGIQPQDSYKATMWDGTLANVPEENVGVKLYGDQKLILALKVPGGEILCIGQSFEGESGEIYNGTMTSDDDCPISVTADGEEY